MIPAAFYCGNEKLIGRNVGDRMAISSIEIKQYPETLITDLHHQMETPIGQAGWQQARS